MDIFRDLFEFSKENKRGLTFFVKGQSITGIVVEINNEFIVARSQTFDRIIIKIESLDAVAAN